MTIERQLESEDQSSSEAISEAASDWLHQFIKHFKLNFIDVSRKLPEAVDHLVLQRFGLEAVFEIIDSAAGPQFTALAELACYVDADCRTRGGLRPRVV